MALILVCPAEHAEALAREHAPSHVLALSGPNEDAPETRAEHRLALAFNDIEAARPGLVAPDPDHVAAILRFGRSWPGRRPLLVHCRMGISRSGAAALALACQHDPERREDDIARALRAASPCATPNRLLVALADAALGRDGRMIAAAAAIGRGADYRPYRSYHLCVDAPGSAAQACSGTPT